MSKEETIKCCALTHFTEDHAITMDLRDYFAAKAMQGILADPNVNMGEHKLAKWAYEMADAMLDAREL
jgi:hypothetical protein